MEQKITLSISATHDASVAIYKGSKLILNLELERIARVKGAGGYSERFVEFCLKRCGIAIGDVDELVLNRKIWKNKGKKELIFPELEAKNYQIAKATVLGKTFNAHFVHHHVAHLAGAYYCSPYSKASLISLDAGGEGINHAIGIGEGNKIKVLDMSWSTCLGYWWAKLPSLVNGLSDGPGKWMALAAYGDKSERILSELRYSIMHRTQNWDRVNIASLAKVFPIDCNNKMAMDIAASLQLITEEILEGAFVSATSLGGSKNLCFSGGVALNCIGNTIASLRANIDSLFIPPNPSDTGLAMGQALYVLHNIMNHPKEYGKSFVPFTGPTYSRDEIEASALKYSSDMSIARPDELDENMMERLSSGQIGARFYGKSEAGPRALGHRSFIGLGNIKDLREKMNNIKKREWFRPLAGIFLEENIDKYLENRIDYSWYMNTSCKIKPEYQKELEGISHIDKTTRPQVLNESICPNTYKILSGVENATGVGAFLNTSYNVQEPLAETPEDAIKTFLRCGDSLDFLQLEHLIITKKS